MTHTAHRTHYTATSLVLFTLVIGLAGCGERFGDRTLSGAGIGAAAGTVGTVVLGGNPLTGALIGGAVGGTVGAVTKSKDIDLGRPIWSK